MKIRPPGWLFLILSYQYTSSLGQTAGSCASDLSDEFLEVHYVENGLPEVFFAYQQPSVTQFYRLTEAPSNATMRSSNPQRFVKVVNLDRRAQDLYVVGDTGPAYVQHADALSARGITLGKGTKLFLVPTDDKKRPTKRFAVRDDSLYVWDPYYSNDEDEWRRSVSFHLPESELQTTYYAMRRGLDFAASYKERTGREYLSNYGRRPPIHNLWSADYFGQEYTIDTDETHFCSIPPGETKDLSIGESDLLGGQGRALSEFREGGQLQLRMTVVSCSPRIFEISRFLSEVEADHLVALGKRNGFVRSRAGNNAAGETLQESRTSSNTWVVREEDAIVDAIYRRAADLMRIDESLLREQVVDGEKRLSSAEPLQVVAYRAGEEYREHVDFGFPPVSYEGQPTRFATLLLYLNDNFEGGETSFPFWVNAETSAALKVRPRKGKAVLFYSMLPDGNMDRLSMHASTAVTSGEKFLANLWVWDPFSDVEVL